MLQFAYINKIHCFTPSFKALNLMGLQPIFDC